MFIDGVYYYVNFFGVSILSVLFTVNAVLLFFILTRTFKLIQVTAEMSQKITKLEKCVGDLKNITGLNRRNADRDTKSTGRDCI